jgi:hypothetical protein
MEMRLLDLDILSYPITESDEPRLSQTERRQSRAKLVGVGAASQRWIPTGERSGLLMRTAATDKRFVVRADEKLTGFAELESAIRQRWQNS